MRQSARIFFLTFIVFSPLFATTNGWYLGAGASAARGMSKIDSSGAANNIVTTVVPIIYNQVGVQIPIPGAPINAQNTYITNVSNSNIGFNGLLGYNLPMINNLSLGVQVDAVINSGIDNFFRQQTTSPRSGFDPGPFDVYFQVSEKYLQSYGFSLLPQWHISSLSKELEYWQSSLLLLVGYRYGLFKSTWNTTGPLTGTRSFVSHNGRNGIEIGLGTQVSLTQHLDLRLVASQTRYSSQRIFKQAALGWSAKSSAQASQATLALVWVL